MESEHPTLSEAEQREFFRRKERLTECLLGKPTPEELIRQAAMLYAYPIILTTSFYRVIAMDDCGLEVDDPVWQTARETGYCGAEYIAHFESEGITREVLSNAGAIVLDRGLGQKIPRILQKVNIFGKPGAYIGIFQIGRRFQAVDLLTADFLCKILSVLLEWGPNALQSQREIHESILNDLLDGSIASPTILKDRMRAALWEAKPVFQCVLITPENHAAGIDNADYVSLVLLHSIPASKILHTREGLLLLLNFDRDKGLPACEESLRRIAAQYGLYLNVSGCFQDLMQLKAYYSSCIRIREAAKKRQRTDRLTGIEDVVFSVLADSLSKEERLSMGQTAHSVLAAYDGRHGTEYCRTLNTYIECGCSATDAAAALYIHRNTITKRLSRIAELCGIELTNGRQLIHFYLTGQFGD